MPLPAGAAWAQWRPGDWLVVADLVLLFAILQAIGLRRAGDPRRAAADTM